jgi:hypothetical protein
MNELLPMADDVDGDHMNKALQASTLLLDLAVVSNEGRELNAYRICKSKWTGM